MGYLAEGLDLAYFVRLEDDVEFLRLFRIGKRTKSKRIKKKIAKRIDSLVSIDDLSY